MAPGTPNQPASQQSNVHTQILEGEISSERRLQELLEPLIRKVLAEMLGLTQSSQVAGQQWYDTADAYALLDLSDAEQLREMVRSGLLRLGKEVRDRRKPTSQKPRYQFHIEKCQKRLAEPPEKRC